MEVGGEDCGQIGSQTLLKGQGNGLIFMLFIIKIKMIRSSLKPENSHRQNLKQIAKMAQYEPTASIPQPSQGFNYTLVRDRYNKFTQHPKVVKRIEKDKLSTILETHSKLPLFPRISKRQHSPGEDSTLQSSRKQLRIFRSYFKRENNSTTTSRDGNLSIDTRVDTQQERNNISEIIVNNRPSSIMAGALEEHTTQKEIPSYSNETYILTGYRRDGSREKQHIKMTRDSKGQQCNQFGSEQDENEYEKQAVPGPGSYSFSYSSFDQTKKSRSTNASFLSKQTRFRYSKKQSPINTQVIKLHQQNHRKEELLKNRLLKINIPFNSKSPRFFNEHEKQEQRPGPEDYYPRQGIEEDLIRNIQHHFKGSFGSNQQRFAKQKKENPQIGPGIYSTNQPEEALKNENFYFKSKQSRFVQ